MGGPYGRRQGWRPVERSTSALAAPRVAVVVGMLATAAAVEIASGGLATPLVAGVAVTVGEFAVNAAVGGLMTQAAENEGEALGSKNMGSKAGEASAGAGDVHGRPAAWALDADTCHASKIARGPRRSTSTAVPPPGSATS